MRIISACCVLHNYCFINNEWNNYGERDNEDDGNAEPPTAPVQILARNKRYMIALHI